MKTAFVFAATLMVSLNASAAPGGRVTSVTPTQMAGIRTTLETLRIPEVARKPAEGFSRGRQGETLRTLETALKETAVAERVRSNESASKLVSESLKIGDLVAVSGNNAAGTNTMGVNGQKIVDTASAAVRNTTVSALKMGTAGSISKAQQIIDRLNQIKEAQITDEAQASLVLIELEALLKGLAPATLQVASYVDWFISNCPE